MSASDRRGGAPRRAGRTAAAVAVLLLLAAARDARAGELRIDLSNDFLAENPLEDQLYTFSFDLVWQLDRYELQVGESVFTDSVHDLRFDETYLAVGRELRPVGDWHPRLSVGALHVGRGLLGERFQNALHDLVGDLRVDIPYVEHGRLYPTLGLSLWRQRSLRSDLVLLPKVKLHGALGFKSTAAVSLEAIWHPLPWLWLGAELGGRYTDADFAPLEPWIDELAPLGELSLGLPGHVVLSWNYNRFGTGFWHVSLDYRWRPDGEPPGPRLSWRR